MSLHFLILILGVFQRPNVLVTKQTEETGAFLDLNLVWQTMLHVQMIQKSVVQKLKLLKNVQNTRRMISNVQDLVTIWLKISLKEMIGNPQFFRSFRNQPNVLPETFVAKEQNPHPQNPRITLVSSPDLVINALISIYVMLIQFQKRM